MCLPQVIKSFQNYRGVATTFYPTLVVPGIRAECEVQAVSRRGAWTVLSWRWRQYTVELATTSCEPWLLTVNLWERRCHVERGRLLSRLRICRHICTANYVMLTAVSQVWWKSEKVGTGFSVFCSAEDLFGANCTTSLWDVYVACGCQQCCLCAVSVRAGWLTASACRIL